MFTLNRSTEKLYYTDTSLTECTARVVKTDRNFVELDRTVAYPEGGGQDADQGVIALPDGTEIRFVHARKMYGSRAPIEDFPDIPVGGIIEHTVHQDDLPLLRLLAEGMPVTVRVDRTRRALLSLSHTASHLLYFGIEHVRPDAIAGLLGCHIRTDAARFDFTVTRRFTVDELARIASFANAMVARGSTVSVYSHADYLDARYWECEGHRMPCGGTHLTSTASVGRLRVGRKSLGKGKDRISVTFGEG